MLCRQVEMLPPSPPLVAGGWRRSPSRILALMRAASTPMSDHATDQPYHSRDTDEAVSTAPHHRGGPWIDVLPYPRGRDEQDDCFQPKKGDPDTVGQYHNQKASHCNCRTAGHISYASQHCSPLYLLLLLTSMLALPSHMMSNAVASAAACVKSRARSLYVARGILS